MSAALNTILLDAQAARDAGKWRDAIALFQAAASIDPSSGQIRHNLALCHFADGALDAALRFARDAVSIRPDLWQSLAIEAKIHRAKGRPAEAESALFRIVGIDPDNPAALAALADLELNEFGDPEAAAARIRPLQDHAAFSVDAELTAMMADLYLLADGPETLTRRLIAFSRNHLRLPLRPKAKRVVAKRPRVALVSPLFSASPVYFMTFGVFEALAGQCDLLVFNRGMSQDWATRQFRRISAEWHDVAYHSPALLAAAIEAAAVDILFDLGGWTDPAALTALSSKPATRMYTWVGGQSATTGLDMFDGWIGDAWQSPASLAAFYAEPLVNIAGGYCDYRPPETLKTVKRPSQRSAIGLVGNPGKIGARLAAAWPSEIDRLTLIDRRYAHARTRDRVTALLEAAGVRRIDFIVPQGHRDYLEALAGMRAIVNTMPYSGGLTSIEAMALDVEVIALESEGKLFCERHHLSHRVTGGRNPTLAASIAALVMK